MKRLFWIATVCTLWMLVDVMPAAAQHAFQTQRGYVPSIEVLGRGDAAAALPGEARPLFYNPAHLAELPTRITAFQFHGGGSGHLADQLRLLRGPINRQQIQRPGTNLDNWRTIRDSTQIVGPRPSMADISLALPSFIYRQGPFGVSAGAFVHSAVDQRFGSGGAGFPSIDVHSRTDALLLTAVGYDASRWVDGLSVGLTTKFTQRYLSHINAPVGQLPDSENVPLTGASPMIDQVFIFGIDEQRSPVWAAHAVGLDVGLHYTIPWYEGPGTIAVAGAAFDVLTSRFSYTLHDEAPPLPVLSSLLPDQTPYVAQGNLEVPDTLPEADRFDLHPSYRVGAAYTLDALGPLDNLAVALDYQGYRQPAFKQVFPAQLHLGAQAQYDILIGRVGLNQGYVTFGAGLRMGHIHVDYAFYGREEGRVPGETYNYVNNIQVALRF